MEKTFEERMAEKERSRSEDNASIMLDPKTALDLYYRNAAFRPIANARLGRPRVLKP